MVCNAFWLGYAFWGLRKLFAPSLPWPLADGSSDSNQRITRPVSEALPPKMVGNEFFLGMPRMVSSQIPNDHKKRCFGYRDYKSFFPENMSSYLAIPKPIVEKLSIDVERRRFLHQMSNREKASSSLSSIFLAVPKWPSLQSNIMDDAAASNP